MKSSSLPSSKKVINLSSFSFDRHVYTLLEKGLNFSFTPRKIPIEEIICDIEYEIKCLPHASKYIIRQDCDMILTKAKAPKSNLSKPKSHVLKSLNIKQDIFVLKGEKGGSTVILNK